MVEELLRRAVERSQPESLRDRCLIVALAAQEALGGDLVVCRSPDGSDHFVNSFLDTHYDFTLDHASPVEPEIIESPDLFRKVPRVARQLVPFGQRFRMQLERRLPILEMHHVVIQDLADNPGSYVSPDFSTVLLLASRPQSLDAANFAPGQACWLKLAKGPIVAHATLTRWIAGSRNNWTDSDLRAICRSTSLEMHRPTWQRVAESSAIHFLLISLENPEVLNVPLYPNEQAYGRAVVSLTTPVEQVAWLYGNTCDLPARVQPELELARHEPLYRFRWERELDIEVSLAIDERMPVGGRFWDRVRIVNHGMREYFYFTDEASHVTELFTDDELTALAEIVEREDVSGRISQRQLAAHARTAGQAIVLDGREIGIDLLRVAETIESLSLAEHMALSDAVSTIVPRLAQLDDGRRRSWWKQRSERTTEEFETMESDDH